MIVVADASVLVGELLRQRGRELLLHPNLRVLVAEHQWEETEHELSGRLEILELRRIFTAAQCEALEQSVRGLIDVRAIEVAPRDTYGSLESTALRRVPRDRATGQRLRLRSSSMPPFSPATTTSSDVAARPGPSRRYDVSWNSTGSRT
jgi:PIN domain